MQTDVKSKSLVVRSKAIINNPTIINEIKYTSVAATRIFIWGYSAEVWGRGEVSQRSPKAKPRQVVWETLFPEAEAVANIVYTS